MISFAIALLSTALVLFASRKSYQSYVQKGVDAKLNIDGGDRDAIDKIDDPFDLYSDDIVAEDQSEKEIVKEEKKKHSILKQKKEIFKSLPANFSILRLISYGVLIAGFIYLKESGNLSIPLYLTGVTSGVIGVMILNWYQSAQHKNS